MLHQAYLQQLDVRLAPARGGCDVPPYGDNNTIVESWRWSRGSMQQKLDAIIVASARLRLSRITRELKAQHQLLMDKAGVMHGGRNRTDLSQSG